MTITTDSVKHQVEETEVARTLREQSFNRAFAHLDHQNAVRDHHTVRAEVLKEREGAASERPTPDLLAQLRRHGLLWSAVARAVGVSDAAVRKWRKGSAIDDKHKRRLARLVALSEIYTENVLPASVGGFGEWLDRRIIPAFSASPLDVVALHHDMDVRQLQSLLDLMLGDGDGDGDDGERVLDRYFGLSWRDEAQAEQRFRIVTDSHGNRILLVDDH